MKTSYNSYKMTNFERRQGTSWDMRAAVKMHEAYADT